MAMQDELRSIEEEVIRCLAEATTLDALADLRVKVTGKKGSLTAIMRMMGKIPPEERPAMGKLANTVRANVDAAIQQRQMDLEKKALQERMQA